MKDNTTDVLITLMVWTAIIFFITVLCAMVYFSFQSEIVMKCISSGKEWFKISENGMTGNYCGNISEIKNLLMEVKK